MLSSSIVEGEEDGVKDSTDCWNTMFSTTEDGNDSTFEFSKSDLKFEVVSKDDVEVDEATSPKIFRFASHDSSLGGGFGFGEGDGSADEKFVFNSDGESLKTKKKQDVVLPEFDRINLKKKTELEIQSEILLKEARDQLKEISDRRKEKEKDTFESDVWLSPFSRGKIITAKVLGLCSKAERCVVEEERLEAVMVYCFSSTSKKMDNVPNICTWYPVLRRAVGISDCRALCNFMKASRSCALIGIQTITRDRYHQLRRTNIDAWGLREANKFLALRVARIRIQSTVSVLISNLTSKDDTNDSLKVSYCDDEEDAAMETFKSEIQKILTRVYDPVLRKMIMDYTFGYLKHQKAISPACLERCMKKFESLFSLNFLYNISEKNITENSHSTQRPNRKKKH
jgi:hypothetical protein